MKLFICKRSDLDWEGGLIIAANSYEKAIELFKAYAEHHNRPPFEIRELSFENEGVLYDDYSR